MWLKVGKASECETIKKSKESYEFTCKKSGATVFSALSFSFRLGCLPRWAAAKVEALRLIPQAPGLVAVAAVVVRRNPALEA